MREASKRSCREGTDRDGPSAAAPFPLQASKPGWHGSRAAGRQTRARGAGARENAFSICTVQRSGGRTRVPCEGLPAGGRACTLRELAGLSSGSCSAVHPVPHAALQRSAAVTMYLCGTTGAAILVMTASDWGRGARHRHREPMKRWCHALGRGTLHRSPKVPHSPRQRDRGCSVLPTTRLRSAGSRCSPAGAQ